MADYDENRAEYRIGNLRIPKPRVVQILEDRITDGARRVNNILRGAGLAVTRAVEDVRTGATARRGNVSDWQQAFSREIKRIHIQGMVLGRGGWNQVTADDYRQLSTELRYQYTQLRTFAQEVSEGKLSEAQIQARMKMYENSARTSFNRGETAAKKAAGFTQKRRVLNPAEHCQDCISFAGRGWVDIDDASLPPPGKDSECLTNCKCDMDYR